MDPRIYKSDDINKNFNMTAKEVWDRDLNKYKLCESKEITLLHIWEEDWYSAQEECKQLINETITKLTV